METAWGAVAQAISLAKDVSAAVLELLPQPVPEPEPQAEHVLTVGDGDLSYSLDVLRNAKRQRLLLSLVATTLDSREELLKRYGEVVAASIAELEAGEDVRGDLAGTGPVQSRCFQGIDGTALAETLSEEICGGGSAFDRVDWLFPHTGQKKIQTNRALLRGFFLSARPLLKAGGTLRVALCAGQGGTPQEEPHRKYGDSWHVVEQAACAGLVLTSVTNFDEELAALSSYRSTGHRKSARSFHVSAHKQSPPQLDFQGHSTSDRLPVFFRPRVPCFTSSRSQRSATRAGASTRPRTSTASASGGRRTACGAMRSCCGTLILRSARAGRSGSG